jgi:hypothetical protein
MTQSIRILTVLGLFALSACGREVAVSEGPPTQTTRSVSRAERLATIGIAQALLHEADVLEGLGQRGEATLRAERVLSLELAPEDPLREPLRLDAHGRLAELALADGRLDAADAAIDRGLAEVRDRSYFEARLHLVRGRVLEARAAAHRAAGLEEEAQAALRAALEAHERSISINEALLRAEEATP